MRVIFDIRTRIIGKAQEGRWNPDRAEQVASRLGVGPIAREPRPADFDPMGLPVWTLPMAIIWIAWRDIERVRRSQENFRSECWVWRSYKSRRPIDGGREWKPVQGWELVQPEPATLSGLSIYEALSKTRGETMLMPVESAREALWAALAEGRIVAAAINNETVRPAEIPRHEWTYLQPTSDRTPNDGLRFSSSSARVEYHGVTFQRTDIVRLWPRDDGSGSLAAGAPAASSKPGRHSPQQARVFPVLAKLYPQGVPDRESLTDSSLNNEVSKLMGRDAPSKETILRAAGRRV